MHDSRRYRDNAAECLLAAQEACELHCRKLHLSMADSWLSLARRDEAIRAGPQVILTSSTSRASFLSTVVPVGWRSMSVATD